MAQLLGDQRSCNLHLLPPDLLRRVWDQLLHSDEIGQRNETCKALRQTCKALRDTTTQFITWLNVSMEANLAEGQDACRNAVQAGLRRLAGFPASGTIKKLYWQFRGCRDRSAPANADIGYHAAHVLPSFFLAAAPRLAAVQSLSLKNRYASITYDDMCAVVDACPGLRHLTLQRSLSNAAATVTAQALAPLSRLHALDTLHLENLQYGSEAAQVFECVGLLSALTSLELLGLYGWDEGAAYLPALAHLNNLPTLRNLQLDEMLLIPGLTHQPHQGSTILQPLSSLSSLTRLCCTYADLPPAWSPSVAPLIATLHLDNAAIDRTAVRALVAAPHLTELHVFELRPHTDLSALPCAWQRLGFHASQPGQLLWLPLQGVTQLYRLCNNTLDWTLRAEDSPAAVQGLVQGAVSILARSWVEAPKSWHGRTRLTLDLQWNATPEPSAAVAVLGALAPLDGRLGSLALARHWEVDGEQARALAQALQSLAHLRLFTAGREGFASFTAGLATTPCPHELDINNYCTHHQAGLEWPMWPLTRSLAHAVMQLAYERVRTRHSLLIAVRGWKLTDEQASQLNQYVSSRAAEYEVHASECTVRIIGFGRWSA